MQSQPLSSPLLEFDASPRAFIEPSETVELRDVPAACVVTFFRDAVHRLVDSRRTVSTLA